MAGEEENEGSVVLKSEGSGWGGGWGGGGIRWQGQPGAMPHGWRAVSWEWYRGWSRAERQEPDKKGPLRPGQKARQWAGKEF